MGKDSTCETFGRARGPALRCICILGQQCFAQSLGTWRRSSRRRHDMLLTKISCTNYTCTLQTPLLFTTSMLLLVLRILLCSLRLRTSCVMQLKANLPSHHSPQRSQRQRLCANLETPSPRFQSFSAKTSGSLASHNRVCLMQAYSHTPTSSLMDFDGVRTSWPFKSCDTKIL